MLNSLLLRKYYKFASLGLAALGFAMLPVAGVFADPVAGDGVMTFDETVSATIANTCGLYTGYTDSSSNTPAQGEEVTPATDPATYTGNYSYSKNMINGETWSSETDSSLGDTYIVVCNDTGGWKVTAVGSGSGSTVDKMDASTGEDDDIATGTAFSGAAANWAFRVTVPTGGEAVSGLSSNATDFRTVPTGAVSVVESTGATDKTATFTTGYKVYIGSQTPAGTYTGKVTYTLVHPKGN